MEKELFEKSKFMACVLRHSPDLIGINIDKNGWVYVEDLINLSSSKTCLTFELIDKIVNTNNKRRFEFNNNKTQIRASQGHSASLNIDLKLLPQIPLPILFHGTCVSFIDSIYKSGLVPKSRQHVHLTNTIEKAILVGKRHGKPVVLKILAEQMYNDGFDFYLSTNQVWLTNSVPIKYIEKV